MKLNTLACALTSALLWGFGVFCVTWWLIAFEGASQAMPALGHLYRGYTISPLGSLIGLAWGLPDGFIGGLLFAWLYNRLTAILPSKGSSA